MSAGWAALSSSWNAGMWSAIAAMTAMLSLPARMSFSILVSIFAAIQSCWFVRAMLSISRDTSVADRGRKRLWLRHQPQSALSRWFHERVKRDGGRMKKTTIVALARKLLVALWKYVAAGVVVEGAVMKAA